MAISMEDLIASFRSTALVGGGQLIELRPNAPVPLPVICDLFKTSMETVFKQPYTVVEETPTSARVIPVTPKRLSRSGRGGARRRSAQ